jgi:hypothetical protein
MGGIGLVEIAVVEVGATIAPAWLPPSLIIVLIVPIPKATIIKITHVIISCLRRWVGAKAARAAITAATPIVKATHSPAVTDSSSIDAKLS